MKHLLPLLFILLSSFPAKSQDYTCWELQDWVEGNYTPEFNYDTLNSPFIIGVDAYYDNLRGIMFVVSHLGSGEYIYCVPMSDWFGFENHINHPTIGDAWHHYIKPNKCHCTN